MNPLYTVSALRAVERAAVAALPPGVLMQRAGQTGANAALDMLPFSTAHSKVLVLAGPGDNGGDALETAAHLAHAGARVTVLYYGPPGASVSASTVSPAALSSASSAALSVPSSAAPAVSPPAAAASPSAERAAALSRARASDARFIEAGAGDDACAVAGVDWDLVVDGLFGLGLARPIQGAMARVVNAVNGLACPVLALDLPSGLDADTGRVVGPDGVAVQATRTVTFIGDKPGLYTCDGRDHAGLVDVARLDLDAGPARLHLNDARHFARHLRSRRHNTHKGSYGDVAVIGGARGMGGAPLLGARAALHSGAGRVHVLFVDDAPACDPVQAELMCRAAEQFELSSAVLAIGPGLGDTPRARALLARAIAADGPLLADADALNLLAAHPPLRAALAARPGSCIVTPHPLEAARLLGVDVGQVQRDRVAAARTLAARLNAVVVLKGSGTVIAAPDGDCVINTTGNPALATAGTGDVLSGLCAGLLAQGWPRWEAALAAVWLHGMAADVLVNEGTGPVGLTAGELIPAIRTALNRMIALHGR